jgi:hypothetical protein
MGGGQQPTWHNGCAVDTRVCSEMKGGWGDREHKKCAPSRLTASSRNLETLLNTQAGKQHCPAPMCRRSSPSLPLALRAPARQCRLPPAHRWRMPPAGLSSAHSQHGSGTRCAAECAGDGPGRVKRSQQGKGTDKRMKVSSVTAFRRREVDPKVGRGVHRSSSDDKLLSAAVGILSVQRLCSYLRSH